MTRYCQSPVAVPTVLGKSWFASTVLAVPDCEPSQTPDYADRRQTKSNASASTPLNSHISLRKSGGRASLHCTYIYPFTQSLPKPPHTPLSQVKKSLRHQLPGFIYSSHAEYHCATSRPKNTERRIHPSSSRADGSRRYPDATFPLTSHESMNASQIS
ncbi:hypothetical protein VC83_04881 [Pseudogymnoascus destructans]|uniref:Uncharacterized protein n=1 Tax=Pseudogymnoascus destructans TaxID=655981 RepID=A0A177A904_9PEZI|nr:uncharacterized protein VC83_04881 [Pseudogymnoascus destructans]OAF58628.1 hypothetical protein VC83_04881 [Pseudogymnoascus destructans]